MKKYLHFLKIFTAVLAFVMVASAVNAQTRTASVPGPWDNTATWGGASVPASTDDVIINNGVTVTVSVDADCKSVTFAGASGTITVNATRTLNVVNGITLQNSATVNAAAALAGAGTINCASVQVGGTATLPTIDRTTILTTTIASLNVSGNLTVRSEDNGSFQNNATYTHTSGSVSVGGGVVIDAEDDAVATGFTTATFTMNGGGVETGTLVLSGATPFSTPGLGTATFDANGTAATVNYSGDAQTVKPVTYKYLILSGSGAKTLTGVTTVTDLTLNGSASALTEAIMTVSGDLLLNNTASLTTGNNFTVTGDATINNGAVLTIGAFNSTITGTTIVSGKLDHNSATGTKIHTGNVTINSGGFWDETAAAVISFAGTLQNDGTLNANAGMHTFSVAGRSFIGVVSIPNVTISGTRTNNGTLTVGTALTLGAALTNAANATLNIGGTISGAAALTATANPNTVNYTGSGQTVKVATYHHLNLSGSGVATAGGILDINGNITIGSGVTLDGSTFVHVIAGNWINDGTFTSSGTVTFNGTTQSIGGTLSTTFNNLSIIGATASTTTLAVNTLVAGNLTLSTGDVLDLLSFSCNRTTAGGTLSLTSTSTLKLSGTTGGQPGSNFPLDFTTYTLSGTVNYNNATGGQTIFGTTYSTLTMGNTSGTQIAGGNIITSTINNNTNAANILDMGLFTLAASTINNTGTVKTQNTSGTPLPTGEIFGGIVEYEGVAQTVRANTYNNLVLSGSGTKTVEANFVINGDITINSGVTLAAPAGGNDDIDINGNWINHGTFTGGDDLVTFSGAVAQSIGGTASTSFADVRIFNPAGVVLNQPASVTSNIQFSSGLLTTSTSAMLTINDGATHSSTTNTSFVNGPVTKIGNDIFTFPVGKSGIGYQPVSISAPGVITDAFTAEYIRSSGSFLGPITAPGLLWVSNCEYWTLDRTTGSSNVNVTLNWNANSDCNGGAYVTTLAGLQIAYFDGATWSSSAVNATSGTATAGTVTRNALPTYGIITIGNVNVGANPLPVMFADVKAFEKNNGVQIEWTNLTERDLINYVVERSANSVNFTTINQQLPRSNQNDKESYSAFDAIPFSGINFYRIKVLEISGKVIYSKVMKVDITKEAQGFALYPNPVKGNQISLSINNKQGQYTMKVLNTAGQEIYSLRIVHQGGSMTQTVELPSAIKPGVYNMLISGDNYREAKMFVIQ